MPFQVKTLLVPVALEKPDEVHLAHDALDAATAIAGPFSARLVLAYVEPPADAPGQGVPLSDDTFQALRSVLTARSDHAKKELEQLCQDRSGKGCPVEARVLADKGGIAETLVECASDVGADMIVIPSHSRRGLKRLFLGSVAERLAHISPVPVLLLPAASDG